MSYNRVILMGNLTRDPETRFAKSGTAVVNFGLAVNERFQGQDGQWQDRPTFVDVTMFGKRAEAFAKFHTKGKQAFIEGKLRLDQWEDKNGGGKRSKLYVVADSFEFVGDKSERTSSEGTSGTWRTADTDGDAWGGAPSFEENSTPF